MPVATRSAISGAGWLAATRAAFAAAPETHPIAKRRRALMTSGRLKSAESSVPATKPPWTAMVSHAASPGVRWNSETMAAVAAVAEHLQLRAARDERPADGGRHAPLDLEHARLAFVVVERAEGMERVDPRRFDRLLKAHLEDEDVQQHVEHLLILAVTAWCADGEKRLAVPQDDRRRQRRARALAAGEHVRAE